MKEQHFPISPTGKGVRVDDAGDGHFGAPRSKTKTVNGVKKNFPYKHRGTDFTGTPGQTVWAPIDGYVVRNWYPYASDLTWRGCVIEGEVFTIIVGYVEVNQDLIGRFVHQRQVIGTLQDIGLRYPGAHAHVHMEIKDVVKNPELFLVNP